MDREEFDRNIPKLENYIMIILAMSRKDKENIDEKQLAENIRTDLLHRSSRIQQTIEKTDSSKNEEIQNLKIKLDEIEAMRKLFEINSQHIISECIKKFYEPVEQEAQVDTLVEKQKNDVGVLTRLYRYNNEQMKKSPQELIDQIRREKSGEMREIFPPVQDVERD